MHVLNLFVVIAVAACSGKSHTTAATAGRSQRSGDSIIARDSVRRDSLHEFADCRSEVLCPRMVVLPAGSFLMGSPSDEPERFDDEGPQRHVAIRSFAVGKFPVTRSQWTAFNSATNRTVPKAECAYAPTANPSWKNPGFPQSDDHPVVCITWGDAQDYASWLGRRTGHRYRLLTEAEWEYAARAGTATPFPWGREASHERANYGQETCCGPLVSGRDQWNFTSPVGSFPPNAFGLYDMQGNVFEWVQDCHAASYAGHPLDGSAYEWPNCRYRVARGGVYADRPALLRSASRNFAPPPDARMTITNYRSSGFGIRIARTLP
jgi:formylglycine-generating enzyme required for sulfatase activity